MRLSGYASGDQFCVADSDHDGQLFAHRQRRELPFQRGGEAERHIARDDVRVQRSLLRPAVTWKVNGITGGNSSVGTINSSGRYTAPKNVPSPNPVTVSATSVEDPTKSGTASVTITR